MSNGGNGEGPKRPYVTFDMKIQADWSKGELTKYT